MQQRVSPALADAVVCKAVADWLHQFEVALAATDFEAAAALFVADGHWRDVLAFTWHLRTFTGRNAIGRALEMVLGIAISLLHTIGQYA